MATRILGHGKLIASEAKRRELLLHVYGISNNRLKSLKIIVENFWKHRNSSFFMPNSFLTWTGPTRPGPARPGRPWRSLTAYISETIWARCLKFFEALEQLFKIVVSNFEMNILKFRNDSHFTKQKFWHFFSSFSPITSELSNIFEICFFQRKEH